MRLFIFGIGYSAQAFVKIIQSRCQWIAGTTRSAEGMTALQELGVTPHLFDGRSPGAGVAEALAEATHVLISIGPDANGDPVLNHYGEDLASAADLKWIGYLSTVGVYGNHDGAWVDEKSACRPVSKRSLWRVAAEQSWMSRAADLNVPLGLFRLAGIYGPGRSAFDKLRSGTAKRIIKPGQVFNRIHVDDIAAVLDLASNAEATGIFNVTDNEPAPPQDVIAAAADIMGIEPPPEIDFTAADMTPMGRSFYGENKRVSNTHARSALGWDPIYPAYREALAAMWQAEN